MGKTQQNGVINSNFLTGGLKEGALRNHKVPRRHGEEEPRENDLIKHEILGPLLSCARRNPILAAYKDRIDYYPGPRVTTG